MQEVVQQIENTAREAVNEVHTALPGCIVAFNVDTVTASVKPIGRFIMSDGTKVDYPVITDVPVVYPFSQVLGAGIAFPIQIGDSCLIVMSEVELDEWRTGAIAEGSLRFDLSNAVCIPGLIKPGNELVKQAQSNNAVVLACGGNSMTLSRSGIALCGDLNVTGSISSTGNVTAAGTVLTGSE